MSSVREMRKRHDMKSKDMANMLSISCSSYCDKEMGRRAFKPYEIVKICQIFNADVSTIDDFQKRGIHERCGENG